MKKILIEMLNSKYDNKSDYYFLLKELSSFMTDMHIFEDKKDFITTKLESSLNWQMKNLENASSNIAYFQTWITVFDNDITNIFKEHGMSFHCDVSLSDNYLQLNIPTCYYSSQNDFETKEEYKKRDITNIENMKKSGFVFHENYHHFIDCDSNKQKYIDLLNTTFNDCYFVEWHSTIDCLESLTVKIYTSKLPILIKNIKIEEVKQEKESSNILSAVDKENLHKHIKSLLEFVNTIEYFDFDIDKNYMIMSYFSDICKVLNYKDENTDFYKKYHLEIKTHNRKIHKKIQEVGKQYNLDKMLSEYKIFLFKVKKMLYQEYNMHVKDIVIKKYCSNIVFKFSSETRFGYGKKANLKELEYYFKFQNINGYNSLIFSEENLNNLNLVFIDMGIKINNFKIINDEAVIIDEIEGTILSLEILNKLITKKNINIEKDDNYFE